MIDFRPCRVSTKFISLHKQGPMFQEEKKSIRNLVSRKTRQKAS
jgi:hypothetical protein